MQCLRRRAYARAGLIGNPSDGYQGKTISFSVRDYWAEVVLYEWDEVEIVVSHDDRSRFESISDLQRHVALHGYYGGVRLVKATIKKFVEYCQRMGYQLHDQNFAVRYASNIPRQVGMAGSSAIIVATLRCLMDFYEVGIERRVQPSLILSVENEELGIGAGLQDRVIQVYEGVVAMDFTPEATETIDGYQCGTYESITPELLPPVFVAFRSDLSEPTEVFHNDLKTRFRNGDSQVVQAMTEFARLTDVVKEGIEQVDYEKIEEAINANFDLRNRICNLNPAHIEMVHAARRAGASAKYSGSGGAIVGTVRNDEMFQKLTTEMATIGCRVFCPKISSHGPQEMNAARWKGKLPEADAPTKSPQSHSDKTESPQKDYG